MQKSYNSLLIGVLSLLIGVLSLLIGVLSLLIGVLSLLIGVLNKKHGKSSAVSEFLCTFAVEPELTLQ